MRNITPPKSQIYMIGCCPWCKSTVEPIAGDPPFVFIILRCTNRLCYVRPTSCTIRCEKTDEYTFVSEVIEWNKARSTLMPVEVYFKDDGIIDAVYHSWYASYKRRNESEEPCLSSLK